MKKYQDARRFDVGNKVKVKLISGHTVSGIVEGVQYSEPTDESASPKHRSDFRYIINVGIKKTTNTYEVKNPDSGKVEAIEEVNEEPAYQTIYDRDIVN